MRRILIKGNKPLNGEVQLSGAKNASLPILIATLLVDGESTLFNIPNLLDVSLLIELLNHLGVSITLNNDTGGDRIFTVNAEKVLRTDAPREIVSKFRASFWVLGPLLTRYGKCKVAMPGGCAIGARPVDIYIDTMKQMGATIEETEEYIIATAPKGGLKGTDITLRLPSVGATHNLIMAATLANGTTIIRNAAKEPEVVDLANFLISTGAKIKGAGTDTITIEGVKRLKGTKYKVICDRIEAFSYIVAAAITKGELIVKGLNFDYALQYPIKVLKDMGVEITMLASDKIRVNAKKEVLKSINLRTDFFPGFPTDCQPIIMPLLACVDGTSIINETIYENRFKHAQELNKLGADITITTNAERHNVATIKGKSNSLHGGEVLATDLRAGMCLVLAGLAGNGETYVGNINYIERGYENLLNKLTACGADISIVGADD